MLNLKEKKIKLIKKHGVKFRKVKNFAHHTATFDLIVHNHRNVMSNFFY